MGISEAVQWWEEWQLRILVLCSLFLQCFLFFAGALRKRRLPAWLRFLIWLAYLSSDAVAIYALATLFNRQKKQEWVSTSLQVLWAPILLVHRGGQNGITAYNIEDNELWRRNVLTTVSQVTVAIYVFCKSWSGDKTTLKEGISLFLFGIFKCILKPWDMKRVSINSLMNSSRSEEDSEDNSLHQYVRDATEYFHQNNDGGSPPGEANLLEVDELHDLFVDLAPPYSHRLRCLKHMVHNGGENAHVLIQGCLSVTFDRLYTKEVPWSWSVRFLCFINSLNWTNYLRVLAASSLLFVIGMLRRSKEAYNDIDVKITYTLLACAAVLEYVISTVVVAMNILQQFAWFRTIHEWFHRRPWPDQVAQYNLLGYLVRNRKHRKLRTLATLLVCKDYVDQLWCMEPSMSSEHITKLIYDYVKKGWTEHYISDTATYRAFNDNRGQWTLEHERIGREKNNLWRSLQRQFDESVLLWHLATDFCFHLPARPASTQQETARQYCREMSNYMAYLLFVNPEMLITGARRSLFSDVFSKLKNMSLDLTLDEQKLARRITEKVEGTDGRGVVQNACALAKELNDIRMDDGEEKMWEVIQGVWVEMLCFCAGWCRGYLHAKSLGTGGEYLSYVWLLLLYMGMETLTEKMQGTAEQELAEGRTAAARTSTAVMAAGDQNV